MKILHLVPTCGWAGTEKIAFSFANYQSVNNDVTIAVKTNSSFNLKFYRNKICSRVSLIEVPEDADTPAKIKKIISENSPDGFEVIHGHLSLGCRAAQLMKRASNVCIGHMHIRFFSLQFKGLDAVIAVSPWQIDDVPKWFDGKVKLIPNFVVEEPKASDAELDKFKRRFYIKNTDFVIGTVSRLHIEKGIDTLIRAFKMLDVEGCKLVVVGEGGYAEKLMALAKGCDNIIFTGFLNDASRYMSAFNLYVSPSRADSFGLSVLEALVYGVPVIASDTFGSRDIFGSRERLFSAENEFELSSLLYDAFIGRAIEVPDISMFDENRSNHSLLAFYCELFDGILPEKIDSDISIPNLTTGDGCP
jgi:glycosyltransferase involved in cell wall biosynthesis